MQHITDYLWQAAADQPDKPALITDDRTLTFAQLKAEVEAFAPHISAALGTDEQKVMALLLPNSWQFMVAYLAALHVGHIVLPLDPSYKRLEIEGITAQLVPDYIITNETYFAEFDPAHKPVLFADLYGRDLPAVDTLIRQPATEQPATLLFTSGTTGKPKITAYSHSNHVWNVQAVRDLWHWTVDDTLLISLPLSHWHGLVMGIAAFLYMQNTLYLHERFDPEKTLKELESGRISMFQHVPIAYWKLLYHNPEGTYDLSKVRLFVSGSSFLPPAIWQGFHDRFGVEILERYGSSETGLIASNRFDERVKGSVGYPLDGVTIRSEEDGQLAMKSGGLFLGYYQNPEATAKNVAGDGLWLTGDIGDVADNGRIILKGRIQEKMKKLGLTIFPRDLEWAMLHDEAIEDIFVIGLQNQEQDGLSDTIVYFVQPFKFGELDEAAVFDFAHKNLPAAWRPDKVVLLEEIPKTRSGKPRRADLLASLES
ncbi:MAG: o-succinylbenzoate--CoA ligase [Candidatus Saccharibacteria bacterium]|nr:o-succinylbenzoate--CoA ligase [Candidatus Saccharibacteria bacterium]